MRLTVFVKTLDGTAVQKAVILFLYIYYNRIKKMSNSSRTFLLFFCAENGRKEEWERHESQRKEIENQKNYRKEQKKHDKMEKIKENSDAAFSISDCIHIYAVWYWRGAGGCNFRRYRKL